MICTRCQGTGFLNADQVPDWIDEGWEAIDAWLVAHDTEWFDACCSCHIAPPCSFCVAQHDVEICDCCGDGYTWYGEPGQHYGNNDPDGPNGPYASNGGLCRCH